MLRRLRFRLTAVCTCATVLVLTVMALFVLRYAERQLRLQAEQSFAATVNAICYNLRDESQISSDWLSMTESSNGLMIRVEIGGRPIRHSLLDEEQAAVTAAILLQAEKQYSYLSGRRPTGDLEADVLHFATVVSGEPYFAATCSVPVTGGMNLDVVIAKSALPLQEQITQLRLVFGASILAASLCLLVFAWLFSRWAARPAVESRQRQAEFVSAASHELKSPLAVMQVSAGALMKEETQRVRKLSGGIYEECQRMKGLVEDLLYLAGADSNRWNAQLRPVDPVTLLLNVGDRYFPLAHEKEVALHVEMAEEQLPPLQCDSARMEQLFVILLDNALRFTPPGGRITLKAGQQSHDIIFSVADTGPGVPDEFKEKVFDRFFQGDGARSDKGHFGLGLSIAKEIAELHKGWIAVEDAPGGGASFVVAIPR